MGLWTGARCHKFLRKQITFELAWRSSNSENCCLLFNFSSASFIRQLSWWYESVVNEDCNFSNFETEAFLVYSCCFIGHRFCTRCLTGEIQSTVMTKTKWSWHFFGADHRPQNAYSSTLFKVHAWMWDSWRKKKTHTHTRKDNLSVILS